MWRTQLLLASCCCQSVQMLGVYPFVQSSHVALTESESLPIHPSSCVQVALSDTKLLSDMLRPLPDFTDSLATADTTAAFYTRRKPLSATINTLANALYQVRHRHLEAEF